MIDPIKYLLGVVRYFNEENVEFSVEPYMVYME